MKEQVAARAEASAWITRLHGPNRTPDMEAGFHQWLRERPENRIEFEGLTDIWTLIGTVPTGGAPRLERWEHTEESRELRELRSRRGPPNRRRTARRWRGIRLWSSAATLVLVLGLTAFWSFRHWLGLFYTTELGEQRVVQLADKSRLWMNSNTRVRVAFDGQQRQVVLLQGEAFFEVTKDALRPFVVTAGRERVTAVGTSFVVRYESDRTAVTLVEGRVAIVGSGEDERSGARKALRSELTVSPQPSPKPSLSQNPSLSQKPLILAPGQRLTLASVGAATIDEPPLESVLAWRRGEVRLNDTPLREAASEMNRYDRTTIVIEDPRVGALNVSGLYHTGDNEGFALSVATMYKLKMHEQDGRIYLKPW